MTIENHALYSLTDLLKECMLIHKTNFSHFALTIDMQEVSKEIKSYTELNGRFDTSIIDTLNGLYNYDMTK